MSPAAKESSKQKNAFMLRADDKPLGCVVASHSIRVPNSANKVKLASLKVV